MWGAFRRGDLIASALGFFCAITGLTWLLQSLPWYVPVVGLATLFFYGVARGIYEDVEVLKRERDEAWDKLRDREKRIALNDLLGGAREEGPRAYEAREEGALSRWRERTKGLIEAAFGKGEAQLFLSDEGYPTHSLPGNPGNDVWAALALSNVSARNQREREIGYRLRRLDSLILRMDSLPICPDFDPQDWTSRQ